MIAIVTTMWFAVLFCGVAALSDLAHLSRLRGWPAKLEGRAGAWLEGGEFQRLLLRVHGRLSILRRVCVVLVLVVLGMLVVLIVERREGDDGAGGWVFDVIRRGAIRGVLEGREGKAVRVWARVVAKAVH